MGKPVRISLANKCQLLFGGAVLLILIAALTVGWVRMKTLVREGQEEAARRLAQAWIDDQIGGASWDAAGDDEYDTIEEGTQLTFVLAGEFSIRAEDDTFLADSIKKFELRDDLDELFIETETDADGIRYRYARAVRKDDLQRHSNLVQGDYQPDPYEPGVDYTDVVNPVEGVLLIDMTSDLAERQLALNRIYILAAGLLAGLLAIGAFWYITTRIVLSPVRVLRDTAEKIAEGDINIRSDINTGDEFEQLSDMFNTMLERLRGQQEELRRSNKSLDLKLGELAESNVALYEANKIKGEFLANVSHELRTPLNSIIGFAEVLDEALQNASSDGADEKRRRYAHNIITSSRQLLELINDLLDLAKIEAGRMEINVAPMSVKDACEGLVTLIRPQAEKRNIKLEVNIQRNLPLVQTDAGKVHQILFNFLSNAVKFTPDGGTVTIAASLTDAVFGSLRTGEKRLRISVRDTGPGIPFDQQERIFEKFTQLDTSHTRSHGGTGLGLTISRDLARMLHGEIELESEEGKGATFSLLLPLELKPHTAPLMPDLTDPEAQAPVRAY